MASRSASHSTFTASGAEPSPARTYDSPSWPVSHRHAHLIVRRPSRYVTRIQTSCSPPPEPTGGPGPASTTTGNGGHSSNAPSPGSSLTATAASATAASNATGSASRPRRRHQPAPAPQPRPHPHRQRLEHSPPDSGSGADKEGTTPSAISHPARPTLTLQHRLFGRSCPRTHHQRYDDSAEQRKRRVAQRSPSWAFDRAGCGNRTHDLMITSQVLYQLS